MKLRYDTG